MKEPPAPPIFLAVSKVEENSAVFNWKLPDNEKEQSRPTQVIITVMYVDETVSMEKTISITDGTNHLQVTNLDPGVQHIASIKSCTGDGMESKTATFLHGQSEECDSALMSEKDEAESNIGSGSTLLAENEHNQDIQHHEHSSIPGTFCTKCKSILFLNDINF